MFQNLTLFPVSTAQKREGQKVLSRTQPLRSTNSETTFIVQIFAKYGLYQLFMLFKRAKSIIVCISTSNSNLIGKVFTKITKKRALLKSIFVIPIRVSFFQFLQHKTLLKMKIYFATKILWRRVTLTWQKLP